MKGARAACDALWKFGRVASEAIESMRKAEQQENDDDPR